MEVRFQGNQSDRQNAICRKAARQLMDGVLAAGIRFLCEREPHSPSPAMESGPRTTYWRIPKSFFRRRNKADASVQWIRRAGRRHVCRHGPPQELLMCEY